MPKRDTARDRSGLAHIRSQHPALMEAVLADAKLTWFYRSEPSEFPSRLAALKQAVRLFLLSDAFMAQVFYRLKARLQTLGVPVLPRIAHRLAMITAQVSIGDPVVVQPGVYFPHGQVVIDGLVVVGSGTVLFPWVTLGLTAGETVGPNIGRDVHIGTGAKLLGPITVGDGAQIGANAVVLSDVPAGATAVGVPARIVDR
jgi:serine O-acetyltransferase